VKAAVARDGLNRTAEAFGWGECSEVTAARHSGDGRFSGGCLQARVVGLIEHGFGLLFEFSL
jgi:hypothetical protein